MYNLCHSHLTNLSKVEKALKKANSVSHGKDSRKQLNREEKQAAVMKKKRKEWMDLVTTIGIERVKELEKDPSKLLITDLRLLANQKGVFKDFHKKTGSIESAQDGEKSDNDKEEEHDRFIDGVLDIDETPKPKM